MKKFSKELTPKLVASQIKCNTKFIDNCELNNVAELAEANKNSVCFFENQKYLEAVKNTKAGLIFVPLNFTEKLDTNLIFVEKPYIYFMQFVKKWLYISQPKIEKTIENTVQIDTSATIGKNVKIGHNCIIAKNVKIGNNTTIEANSVINENTEIGENCYIFSNCTIYGDCILKNNVVIHSGCVIGADGFGYIFFNGIQNKVPQIGNVIIGNDVEIGANSTIDRATIGSTIIGRGTKIDNLVQIGHNCKIGENCILCGQVGLAGNSELGNNVYLAGQVGVAGHLKIGDNALVGAQSGVTTNLAENGKYFGMPAIDANLKKRIIISEKWLPKIVQDFKKRKK